MLFKHGVPSVAIHERAEIHLRCANVIESTFAAVRHRTKDHLRAGLESGRLAMAYKLTAQGGPVAGMVNASPLVTLVPDARLVNANTSNEATINKHSRRSSRPWPVQDQSTGRDD
ncbi:MAG TPA: hypothetical protein VLA79_03055, partial [Polyangia bacterium]|nr:hypothetical protein [Polyangia bacterium]